MRRNSPALYAIRARLEEHFELFMTTVGVLLAILITLSELSRGDQGMALIFLIWLQGFILWAVHRHFDSHPDAISENLARDTVVHFVVHALAKE